jgi:hypothetical protein
VIVLRKAKRPALVALGFGLAVLVAVVPIGAWLARDNIFVYTIQPRIPFQVAKPPPAPDYSQESAWLERGRGSSRSEEPAVFYVHDTSRWTGAGWNMAFDDQKSDPVLFRDIIPNQLGPFSAGRELWVPRYRQATLFALLAGRPDTRDALDVAYGDVGSAFDHFLATRRANQPFILVGYGQGGLHVLRLLIDKVASQPVRDSLIAAYALEQGAGQMMFAPDGPLAGVQPCASPEQTACIISYVTADRNDVRMERNALERARRMHRRIGLGPAPDRLVCTNPLTGTLEGSAPASANRGAASASGLEPSVRPALLPGETGASCVSGLLEVDPTRPSALLPDPFDIGALQKPAPYNLFWQALEEDANRRQAAFKRNGVNQ